MFNLKKILSYYNIQEFEMLPNNLLYESPNRSLRRFLIQSKGKTFILKAYPNKEKENIKRKILLLNFLKKSHFPTTYFLMNKENNYFVETDNFIWTLENYIPFIPLKRPDFILDLSYAEKIAHIYKEFRNISQLNNFYKQHFEQIPFINRVEYILADIKRINNEIYHIFQDEFETIKLFLNNIQNIYEPAHGDFHPMNILFTTNKTYLIDWEFSNLHIKYYDLAILFGCIFADSPDKNGIKFIEKILNILNFYNDKIYILQLSYISRLFWIIDWLKNQDIEALKWEKYIFYTLKDFI